ncbi:MAG: DUF1501 domain-containing protein [Burkholderiales bacterium]|nr:DUF1501 domain-containing protein [Burkholderiales bacterium]
MPRTAPHALRRRLLLGMAGGPTLLLAPRAGLAQPRPGRLLVLVELKGANDGLNTVVPYADAHYYALRPRIAIRPEDVLALSPTTGLHPALAPLLPVWRAGELAIVEGVGYPQPNLSHFRSIEIWDTASSAQEVLQEGWLTRAFVARPVPDGYLADGVAVGGTDLGPLAGAPRGVALADPEQFLRQARLIDGERGTPARNAALRHILQVEANIAGAAARLNAHHVFRTAFPAGPFGAQVRTAAQVAANPAGVAAIRLSLGGFDTHQNQPGIHANLLRQLGEGLAALKGALEEIGRWDDALIMTYAEFGRRPRENQSMGTDHGTAAPHFVMGGRVRGGLAGAPPRLDRLDTGGNLSHAVDFRALYATVLERWWQVPSAPVLGGRFAPLDLLRG